jgi:hypothetical protein
MGRGARRRKTDGTDDTDPVQCLQWVQWIGFGSRESRFIALGVTLNPQITTKDA